MMPLLVAPLSEFDRRLETARWDDMDEVGGLVVQTEENPIVLEDDAQERRAIAMVRLAATRGLGERFAKAFEIITKLACSGKAKARLDVVGYGVGLSDKRCSVNDSTHSDEALCKSALLGAALEFLREHTLTLQCPPFLNVEQPGLDRLAALSAAYVICHFGDIVGEGDG